MSASAQPATPAMPRLRAAQAAVRALLRDIGWVGIAGIALLLLAVPAWWWLVAGSREEAAALKADIARTRARRFVHAGAEPAPAPARQLERFKAAFPGEASLPAALGAIDKAATASKVALASGEYKLAEERTLGMLRYEARYPVKGGWRDVFGLVARLLNDLPYLSLDEVSLKRESHGAAEVEAQLRVSVYLRDEHRSASGSGISSALPAGTASAPSPAVDARSVVAPKAAGDG